MHRHRSTAAIIIALAGLAACQVTSKPKGKGSDGGASINDAGVLVVGPRTHTIPGPNRPLRPPEPTVPMPHEMRFKLLEPGKGARTVLRYQPSGQPRELVARAKVTTRSYVDGDWTDTLALATIRDGFAVTAGPPPAGAVGSVLQVRGLTAAVESAGASPAAVTGAEAYVARWRALLEKQRADITVDDRGRFVAAVLLSDPAGGKVDARDELVQRWLGLVVPLPDEAVGVGARWRVVTALRTGGAVLKQTATYTLTAADAGAWTVAIESERIGEPQDIVMPGAPDVIGEVVALRRVVSGTVTVGPGDPLPLRGSFTSEVSSHARFRIPGRTTERYSEDHATVELGPP